MAAEFICLECGEPIVIVNANEPPEFRLCALCLTQPGWFRDPHARAAIAPHHDGREAWEREVRP